MTIPSRPAPAPPGSRAQNAAAGANASLEQLRLQLQQQQHLGSLQNINIKLPPPPPGGVLRNSNNNNNINTNGVTRKFPQARYAPSTNWEDDPFEAALKSSSAVNGGSAKSNYKKVPPPRPPPPKVGAAPVMNSRKPNAPLRPPPHTTSTNILNSLFNKKKSQRAAAPSAAAQANTASRIYGVSSGYGSSTVSSSNYSSSKTYASSGGSSSNDWNACWNSVTTTNGSATTTTSSSSVTNLESPQLISFDSPPSSPTFTQKSASDCLSVDSFSSDSNFSSPNNGSVSQPESGFEDDFSAAASRSRPPTTTPLDPWDTLDAFATPTESTIGTAPVRNLNLLNNNRNIYSSSTSSSSSSSHYGSHHSSSCANIDNPLCNGKSLLPPPPSVSMPTIIKPKVASQKPKAPKPPGLLQFQQRNSATSSLYDADLATPPSPPMPMFAPPPGPPTNTVTLLDVIAGRADASQLVSRGSSSDYGVEDNLPPFGVALYDFEGVEVDDLSFRENEKIYLLEQVSDEWYRGRNRSGCEGIFPINYVDIKVPLSAAPSAAAAVATPASTVRHSAQAKIRCLYNFPAEVEGDLPLKENEEVTVLYKINEDWLYGEIHGQRGQFPSNFLEYVPSNLAIMPS